MASSDKELLEESSANLVEINPSALQFMLTRGGSGQGEASTPKCIMTLKHPGGNEDHIAFKVRSGNDFLRCVYPV